MKLYAGLCLGALILSSSFSYNGSTTAPVIIAGGIIKAKSVEVEVDKKYKRKDCPVCKGKGWYMSGDNIKKVECGYCEPETTAVNTPSHLINNKQECHNGQCPTPATKRY